MSEKLEDVLQKIYDQERNVRISSFWDGGWTVEFGDRTNGFTRTVYCDKASEIVDALTEEKP